MIIGFAGNGHLMEYAFAAAHAKGFKVVKYTPIKTGDAVEDLTQCDIVYICPDRPGNIEPQAMVDLVLPHLNNDAIVIIHCQVEPGFTRKINWPDSQLYYHVETLKVNNEAMDRALNPDRIIVGYPDHVDWGDARFRRFLESFNCPIIPMSYESAELAKIAINIYLAAQIETSNMLSKVALKIGAEWNDIIPALQTDKRIGEYAYLKPGELGKHLQRDVDMVKKLIG